MYYLGTLLFSDFRAVCRHVALGPIANPRKLEHGFRRISARIPYTLH